MRKRGGRGEIPPNQSVRRAGYTISQKGEKILVEKRWEAVALQKYVCLGTGASLYHVGLSKTFSDIDDDTADYFYCVLKIRRNNF